MVETNEAGITREWLNGQIGSSVNGLIFLPGALISLFCHWPGLLPEIGNGLYYQTVWYTVHSSWKSMSVR